VRLQPRRQRRQRADYRLASRRVDRLRLRALHIGSFAVPNRVAATERLPLIAQNDLLLLQHAVGTEPFMELSGRRLLR